MRLDHLLSKELLAGSLPCGVVGGSETRLSGRVFLRGCSRVEHRLLVRASSGVRFSTGCRVFLFGGVWWLWNGGCWWVSGRDTLLGPEESGSCWLGLGVFVRPVAGGGVLVFLVGWAMFGFWRLPGCGCGAGCILRTSQWTRASFFVVSSF